MKVRKTTSSGDDKIELQMTPMIDIVFQLLTFFIMTLKIIKPEGDFNVTMPAGGTSPSQTIEEVDLPIHIKITANDKGEMASLERVDGGSGKGRSFKDLGELREYIRKEVTDKGGPGSDGAKDLEVELDCDYGLHYHYTVEAISAVSGEKEGEEVKKWIEKIKFTPPK